MSVGYFKKSSGLAALAASLAMLALPGAAHARPDDQEGARRGWNRGGDASETQRSPRGDRGNWTQRAEPPQAQVERPAPPAERTVAQTEQRSWAGSRGDDRGNWRQRGEQRAQVQSPPQTAEQQQRREWSGQRPSWQSGGGQERRAERRDDRRDGQWDNRNRAYADGSRNTTYRNPAYRSDSNRSDWQRYNASRLDVASPPPTVR